MIGNNHNALGRAQTGDSNALMNRVIGGALILFAVVLAIYAMRFPLVPADAASVTLDGLKDGMGLAIPEAVLLDQYAVSGENDRTTAYHCALSFDIADGQKVIISLEVPTSGDLFEKMWAYMNDESAYRGDCVISPLYATASSLNAKLAGYLQDYVKSVYGPLTPYRTVALSLTVRGKTPEAYAAGVSRERNVCLIGGTALLLAGAAILILSFRRRR